MNIDEDNLKEGLLGLMVALVEVIKEVLEGQAIKRMDSGRLAQEEVERLGVALMDMDAVLESLKKEHDLDRVVKEVRKGLDGITGGIINPQIEVKDGG